ncbi:MAG: helix-turn-helix domain-containing protein [Desulfohalobiaceae bacterium]|nr:helix-turn-helix domain-containing protein [Desulfohalobiaceae bacterium]
MAKKFSRLREQMSSEAREKAQDKAQEMLTELPLHEVRQARGMTQKVLADVLQVKQPAVAKLEKRTDMYISTLRSHIQAMGGELDIIARFPDGSSVKIDNFSELENDVQKNDKSRRVKTSVAT